MTTNRTNFNTSAEVEAAFRADFAAFLANWKSNSRFGNTVDFTAVENDPVLVDIPAIYDGDGNIVRPYTSFEL